MKISNLFKKCDRCAMLGVLAFVLTFVALTLFYSAQSSLADEYLIQPNSNQSIDY